MSKRFSAADVASHKTANDLYIVVDEDVYDLTNFQEEHPGGKKSKYSLSLKLHPLTDSSPSARSWQGRLEAILEVPQRQHLEEVPEAIAGRLIRHEGCTTSRSCHRCEGGQEANQGHCEARGEFWCHCASADLRGSRGD